jgi:hypothetical protein
MCRCLPLNDAVDACWPFAEGCEALLLLLLLLA